MRIGELAARAGVTVRTVRYYIEIGLLPPPAMKGSYGDFDETYLQRLQLVRRLKEERLTLPAIRERLIEMGLVPTADGSLVASTAPRPWEGQGKEGQAAVDSKHGWVFRSRFAEEAGLTAEQVAQLESMGLLESGDGLLSADALPLAQAVADLLSWGASLEDIAMVAVYVRREARLHRRMIDPLNSEDVLSRALQWQEQVGAIGMLRESLLWRWAYPSEEGS